MYDPVYELEHYGVIGMKWGIKKDPQKAYAKAGAKLAKLDQRVAKYQARGAQREQSAVKRQQRASSAILFKKGKAERASKATSKALQSYQKAQTAQIKAYRWNEEMRKAFKGIKIKNANSEYVSLGKKYAKMSIDTIMQNNASVNAMMQIENYYRQKANG